MRKPDPLPNLPKNLDAERAILGAMLLNPKAVISAFSIVEVDEFFLHQHRVVYQAMQGLSAEGREIDLVTVVEELIRQSKLEAAGGAGYVSALMDGVPKATNVVHYANIVREKYQLRQLIHFCSMTQATAETGNELPHKLFEEIIANLLDVVSTVNGHAPLRNWQEVSRYAMEQVQHTNEHPNEATRLRFGLYDLDELTSGLRKKELVVIVGPTSHGKSLLAEQLAITADDDGYKGIIFTAEMPAEQVVLRQLAYEAGVEFYYVRRPEKLSSEELARLQKVATRARNISIVDHDVSPMRIWAMAEAQKRTKGLDFVVVDYDQLVIEMGIDPDTDEKGFFAHQRRFILEAQRLAERLDICFILLSQLRKVSPKVVHGAKPTLDDIYGDSTVRNTPHLILWIVREFFTHDLKREYERKVTVYVLKARSDRTGKVQLEFDPERLRLLDAPPTEKDSVPDTTREPGEED